MSLEWLEPVALEEERMNDLSQAVAFLELRNLSNWDLRPKKYPD
jgi:hypothetical protein